MGMMLAEIGRIVKEDISNRVSQDDVLFESISNSIHSNSTEVICTLSTNDSQFGDGDGDFGPMKVDTITIKDNGDGMTNENYQSFCRYRTEHKKELGCKGVGRFVFLKVYESAKFQSRIKDLGELRTFKFGLNFNTDDLQVIKEDCYENSTEVSFSALNPQYYDLGRNIDRRIEMDLEGIREKVLINLIPTLFFFKKRGVSIKIIIEDSNTLKRVEITEDDIPSFESIAFSVLDRHGASHEFKLNHAIEGKKGKLHAFFCAHNRTVNTFSDKELNISLPSGYSGFFLVESEYLDSRVNLERNGFDILPIRTDLFHLVSWEMINDILKKTISGIVQKHVPDAIRINKEKLRAILQDRPYLSDYIESDDVEMAGFLDSRHIIEKAKKKFDNEKEKVLASAGKSSFTNEELNEAIALAQAELVSYINDRNLILSNLRSLIQNKEQVEKVVHNLFMKKNSTDDYFTVGKNNLWLLDDRYTTYSYAASDKKISEVLSAIGEDSTDIDNPLEKPDLAMFFSNSPYSSTRLKSVLIEVKPFDYKKKSDRKKFEGIQQLKDYVEAFRKKESIEEVFAFLVTEVDGKFAKRLLDDGFTRLFSLEDPIFHRHYPSNISIHVVSATTLVKDAEARNKVFLDIIRRQSRLQKLLASSDEGTA